MITPDCYILNGFSIINGFQMGTMLQSVGTQQEVATLFYFFKYIFLILS